MLAGGWIGFEVWRAGRNKAVPEPPGDARPSNPGRPAQLPPDIGSFTGRASEVDQLVGIVDEMAGGGAVAVFVIDGMAGIGKTSLAVHAAHRLADRFPDGCLFLDLHGYTESVPPVEPTQALQRLLRAAGVPGEHIPAELDDQAALWRSRMTGRRVLMVLDNARAAEQVRPLLPASPGCLVLVTSRRRLPALDDARSLSLDALSAAEAVTLFGRVSGPERIRDQDDVVRRVVEHCGRLPLALRIAGARLRARPTWTLTHLAGLLADQAAVVDRLDDGERSVVAALALSLEDLDADRRRVFRRLSLHPGTEVDAGAAAALDGVDEARAGRVLENLFDAHLLLQPATGRYRFHDLVRAYSARLERAEEPDDLRRAGLNRLFDHYTATTAAAVALLHPAGGGQSPRPPSFGTPEAALAWLDAERANLVAISGSATAHDRPDVAVRLSAILRRYLQYGGYHADGLAIHGAARDAARAGGDRAAEADATNDLAVTLEGQGRYARAAEHLREALDLATGLGDATRQAHALERLGYVHWRSGPYDVAADYLGRALAIARQLGDPAREAAALDALGLLRERQGRDDEAAELFHTALRLFRGVADRASEADALNSLGCISSRQGRHETAAGHLREAIAIHRSIGSRIGEAHATNDLGVTHLRQGRPDEAARLHERALAVFTAAGDRGGQSEAHNGLGRALLAAGETARAGREHRAALALAAETGDRFEEARAHTDLAHVQETLGNPAEAALHRRSARAIHQALGLAVAEDVT
ncbi:tetratricopeptide repeat protein [Dactylosporangium sp. NPDC049140]|uniref:ATP-binding protein n=1 Tax=Dactylosporangium sp. NPDC049140 TaxID=3155647 RepID=UPI00340D3B4B